MDGGDHWFSLVIFSSGAGYFLKLHNRRASIRHESSAKKNQKATVGSLVRPQSGTAY